MDEISESHETANTQHPPGSNKQSHQNRVSTRGNSICSPEAAKDCQKVGEKNVSTAQAHIMSSHKQPSPKTPHSLTASFLSPPRVGFITSSRQFIEGVSLEVQRNTTRVTPSRDRHSGHAGAHGHCPAPHLPGTRPAPQP